MKTSLLLIGLIMGAGVVGTAQAADATECTHSVNLENRALATTAGAGHGMLAEFADMLSVHLTKDSSHASGSSNADTSSQAPQGYPHQPGPASANDTHDRNGSDARNSSSAPMSLHAEGNPSPAPASSDDPPTLGWQSLLPGSIQ